MVRTVAAGCRSPPLSAEASYLVSQWSGLRASPTPSSPQRCCCATTISCSRSWDLVNDQVAAIVDQQQAYDQVRHLVGRWCPICSSGYSAIS